jgi:hypothetical protein
LSPTASMPRREIADSATRMYRAGGRAFQAVEKEHDRERAFPGSGPKSRSRKSPSGVSNRRRSTQTPRRGRSAFPIRVWRWGPASQRAGWKGRGSKARCAVGGSAKIGFFTSRMSCIGRGGERDRTVPGRGLWAAWAWTRILSEGMEKGHVRCEGAS